MQLGSALKNALPRMDGMDISYHQLIEIDWRFQFVIPVVC
jgi:hypothetical protein